MKVGVVDVGTNSVRLLITDGVTEFGRWVEVTGLGRGVDATGRLSEDAMDRTVPVLGKFGLQMTTLGVDKRYAMATSACRDASNRDEFLDRAEKALGVRPDVISAAKEGLLSFDGAEADFAVDDPILVSDIGGGSTELVIYDEVLSIQMGSVRLTDRMSPVYPLPERAYEEAMEMAWAPFQGIDFDFVATHIGVAATWTTLAAIAQDLPRYETSEVHGYWLDTFDLDELVDMLCDMTLAEIEAIPSLDPRRAPVIRAGAMVAHAAAGSIGLDATLISVKDSLDGAALGLLGLTLD